tara:strand:- start:2633 stop:3358 length:726 start_codon:yes stop_codon:yes gene_type:complete
MDNKFLSINQQEENQENENICRFCLENDNQEDLFKPCLCNSKVHKECLRQWRILHSTQEDNFLKCEICKHEYSIKNNNKENNCFKCCNIINNNRFLFCIIIFFIINLTLTFIYSIFKNINTDYFLKISHEKDVRDYIISVSILLSISLFILIINDLIFFCKNKKNTPQYINKYYHKFAGVGIITFIIVLALNFFAYLLLPILGIVITTMLINLVSFHVFQIYINKNNVDLYEVLSYEHIVI